MKLKYVTTTTQDSALMAKSIQLLHKEMKDK